MSLKDMEFLEEINKWWANQKAMAGSSAPLVMPPNQFYELEPPDEETGDMAMKKPTMTQLIEQHGSLLHLLEAMINAEPPPGSLEIVPSAMLIAHIRAREQARLAKALEGLTNALTEISVNKEVSAALHALVKDA